MMSSIYDDIENDKMKLTQNYEHYPINKYLIDYYWAFITAKSTQIVQYYVSHKEKADNATPRVIRPSRTICHLFYLSSN